MTATRGDRRRRSRGRDRRAAGGRRGWPCPGSTRPARRRRAIGAGSRSRRPPGAPPRRVRRPPATSASTSARAASSASPAASAPRGVAGGPRAPSRRRSTTSPRAGIVPVGGLRGELAERAARDLLVELRQLAADRRRRAPRRRRPRGRASVAASPSGRLEQDRPPLVGGDRAPAAPVAPGPTARQEPLERPARPGDPARRRPPRARPRRPGSGTTAPPCRRPRRRRAPRPGR